MPLLQRKLLQLDASPQGLQPASLREPLLVVFPLGKRLLCPRPAACPSTGTNDYETAGHSHHNIAIANSRVQLSLTNTPNFSNMLLSSPGPRCGDGAPRSVAARMRFGVVRRGWVACNVKTTKMMMIAGVGRTARCLGSA
ncbi:hypothetical protein GALMADRAFT_1163196 [Galerina marginata CBS 339.88]|uniref:Uncharacterized protein n=1 Tax=Galerina marginata (strain CBS 339.88) TaxID=685588 RepID=A0A067TLB0_GALM3|nr:hypothetical protein GALMADRAFT_1163196 [Galerina marginata CBS 339.88]